MTHRTYTAYNGPSHGWLKVKTADVVEVGGLHFVSPYSHITADGKTMYLEEDCDSTRFLEVAEILGWKITIRDKYIDNEDRIRNLHFVTDNIKRLLNAHFAAS